MEKLKAKLKDFKWKNWLLRLLIIIICLPFLYQGILELDKSIKKYEQEKYVYEVYRDNAELAYQSAKYDLVEGINEYIHTIAPKSVVNGIVLLEACEEYNIDIKFTLAQAQIESHFGTTGLAARTNSIFNVFASDGITYKEMHIQGKTYTHPDHSIIPYMKLLKKKYLTEGKTELDLLENYSDSLGNRYATAPHYEQELLKAYIKIDSIVNISELYREYNKRKILVGK